MNKILYGDYIYIQVSPATKGKPTEPQNFLVGAGFYSPQVWAGKASHLTTKNYLNCLFQIYPNQHSEKDKYSVEAENRYLILKDSEGANPEAVRLFGNQIALEKKKEAARAGRVELLNQKEKNETFGNPLKLNGKFALRHVESGMFLDLRPRAHPLNSEITDLYLTYQPATDNSFTLHNPNQYTELSENAEYGVPLILYSAKYNLFMAHSVKPYKEDALAREIRYSSGFLNNDEFPKPLVRRQQAHQENNASFLVGGQLAKSLVVFENYKRKKIPRLKTGDYIRISYEGTYLTALWHSDKNLNRIYFQSFESMEYRYNQSNTIFYLVSTSQVEDYVPTQELIMTADLDKASKAKDYFSKTAPKKYYLKHYVSGCYLVLNNQDKPTLVTEEELKKDTTLWPNVVLLAKPYEGLQQIGQNFGFVLGFMKGNDIKYLTAGATISTSKDNNDVETKYYFGFKISGEYLYNKLRPHMLKPDVIASTHARKNDFKYDYVRRGEMQAILHTESYANQLISFLNFLEDFKMPYGRKTAQEGKSPIKEEEEKNYEKEVFELTNQYMRKLGDYTRDLMHKAPLPKGKIGNAIENAEKTDAKVHEAQDCIDKHAGEDVDEDEDDTQDSSQLSKAHLYAAREFKVIDLIGILTHTFITEQHVLAKVKDLNTKYEGTANYTKFDNQDCIYFLSSILELVLLLVRSEYNNHSYAVQYAKLFISALVYQHSGILSLMTLDEKYNFRELLLEVACEMLWDEDINALGQLNHFRVDILDSISREKFYQALYVRLLNHQAQNKAPNFKNLVQEEFIKNFLSQDTNMAHIFPILDFSLGPNQMAIRFQRKTYPEGNFIVNITDLARGYQNPPLASSTDEMLKQHYELARYLLASFRLANSMARVYDLNYYQLLIKHYSYDTVKKAIAIVGNEFYEFLFLLTEMINQVHSRYLRLPINNFPPHIRIAGADATFIKGINSKFSDAVKTLISDVELEVINERGLKNEIEHCTSLTLEDLQQESEDTIPNGYSQNKLLYLSTVKSVLSDPLAKVSLNKLKLTHKNLCEILSSLKESTEPGAKKQILDIINIFCLLQDKMIIKGAQRVIEELMTNSASDIGQQSPKLDSSKLCLLGDNSARPNKVVPVGEEDLSSFHLDDPAQQQQQAPMFGIPVPNALISQVTGNLKSETVRREHVYLMEKGQRVENIEQDFKKLITANELVGHLYNLTTRKDYDITMQVVKLLRRISNFKADLVEEFKRFTVLSTSEDVQLVSELININIKFNKYIRLFRCKSFFEKQVPESRIAEIFKTIDKSVNTLLFAIYDPKKHFQYKDLNKDAEERLLEGITKWKTPQKDRPFKIRDTAVNKIYQKIFSSLKVPETLLEIASIALEITNDVYSENNMLYLLVFRKIIIILMAYVYKNEENQMFLSKKKFMILNYYNPKFLNQTCDVIVLFSEMIRDHKYLRTLPARYLYDITWSCFWQIIDRQIDEKEVDCNLSAVLMSLPYLSQVKMEGKDPLVAINEKFDNMFTSLAQPNPKLDIFELYKGQSVNSLEPSTLELPHYYFTIREFFCSWDEVRPKLVTSLGVLNQLFDDVDMKCWLKVFLQPSLRFQFEIRNLLCKTMARTCYGTYKLSVVQDIDEFRSLMYELLSDLDSFITFMSKEEKNADLIDYRVDFDWLVDVERKKARQEAYDKFQKEGLFNYKVFIYAEDIPIINLWKEYIYEGLIELLNEFMLKECDQMAAYGSLKNDKFPNLLSYYLHLLQNLSLIYCDARENPFVRISENLQKASQIAEYKEYKDLILKAIGMIRKNRVEIKGRTRQSTRTRKEIIDSYDNYIETMKRDKAIIRELHTKGLALELGKQKNCEKIIIQLFVALRRGFLGMDGRDLKFLLTLLRKFIEKENSTAPPNEPIYMWESVKIRELKKINYLQKLYQLNGLTTLIFRIASQIKEMKILKELLQLGLAYLYGGNNFVQEEFFEKFSADENNVFLKKLAELLDISGSFFKEKENERVAHLYDQSLAELFADEQLQMDQKTLFERVMENYDPDDTVDALGFKENSLLLLLASFLQGLAEKQCNNIQNFFRDQRFGLPDDKASSRNTINFIGKLRSLFNSYYKIHNSYNVFVGYKIVDVLTEFIQGDVPQNIEDVCKKTFLYDLCRLITEYNNQLHLLARGYDYNPYQGKFMELKSKIIGLIKSIAESPNRKVIEMIKNYADLQGILDVFEGCMYQYFGWTEDNLPNKHLVFPIVMQKIDKIQMGDLYGILGDALNIYIIFRYIWEDKEVFAEETRIMIKNSGRNEQKEAILQALLHGFCLHTVRSVEIVTDKEVDLIKYWFPLFPLCNFLLDSTKRYFLKHVDRTNTQTKIRGLIDASDELIPQMKEELIARTKYAGFNANILYTTTRVLTNAMSLVIVAMNVLVQYYDLEADPPEFKDYNENVANVRVILNIVNAGLAAAVIVLWLFTSVKRHLSVLWERYNDDFKKEVQVLPQAVQDKFQKTDTEGITEEDCILMLKYKGIYSDEFEIMQNDPSLYKNVRWTYWGLNIWFIVSSWTFSWHLIYVGISIASIFHPILTTLLIADIAAQSDSIKAVLLAVTTNWKQFLWTLFLLFFVATFYTFTGFYLMQNTLQAEPEGENEPVNYYCLDTFGCLLYFLDRGLRDGGGIGESLVQTFYTDDPWAFIGKFVYELSFFIVIKVVLLNLIFGMIVDAFGDLRDQKRENEEDQENTCFICGINRSEFERYLNFEEHITQQHHIWDYLYFIIYLREKYAHNKNDLNEIENTVYEKYMAKNLNWIPVSRSIALERKQQELGSKKGEMEELHRLIKSLLVEVKEIKKNVASTMKKAQ